jgi:hypothetical protein
VEFLVIFFPLMLIMFLTGRSILTPYMNGTKEINRTKYPTLARTQRILRARNAKVREKEAQIKLQHFEAKRLAIEDEVYGKIEKARDNSRDLHGDEISEWNIRFRAITAERDAEIAREKAQRDAELRAREAAIREELRAAELEIWTANERERLKRFKAEQAALNAAESLRYTEEAQRRESALQGLRKYYVPDHHNQRFGYRVVNVHGLYVRNLPIKSSRMLDNLTTGAMVSINGWIQGEEVYGNPIWFKLANEGGWIWSGGVDNKSTSGLVNYNYMNEPGDSFTTKSADGTVVQTYECPSEMKTLIDAEILALEEERPIATEFRSNTITANLFTTDKLYPPQPPTFKTADQIARENLSGGRIIQPKKKPKKVTQNYGHTGTDYSGNGYVRADPVNFWTGTEYE